MPWIPVSKQKPPIDEPIVYARPGEYQDDKWYVGIAYWTVSDKWNPEMESVKAPYGFTHWMPLPERPLSGR